MKINIDRYILARALGEVTSFVNPKNAISALRGIKVTVKGNRIKFEANNMQSSIRKYVDAIEVDTDGAFVIDADFEKYIAKIKDDTVIIECNDNNLIVKHKKGEAEFPTIPVDQFVSFNMPKDDTTEIVIPSALLAECINIGRNFVGNDVLRPQMQPIFACVKDGIFEYCATDTRIMVNDNANIGAHEIENVSWYIEPSVFSALAKGCNGIENVAITITPQAVSYKLENTVILTTQTKAQFPDYKRVIPHQFGFECHVGRNDLLDTHNRVSMLSDDTRLIKLTISPMDITVSSENLSNMRRSSEILQHNGSNGEVTIGFNLDCLQKCLGACKSDEICMRLTDASRPMIIYQEDKPNMTILIMPMNCK